MKSAKDLKSKIVKEHVKSTQFLQSWSLAGAYCSPGGQLWVWRPVIRLVHRALCIVLTESFWSRQYRQLSSTAMGRLHIALLPLALLLLLVNLPASSSAPQVNEMQGMIGGDSNQVYVKKLPRTMAPILFLLWHLLLCSLMHCRPAQKRACDFLVLNFLVFLKCRWFDGFIIIDTFSSTAWSRFAEKSIGLSPSIF